MSSIRSFQVAEGLHFDANTNTTYKKGDIINTSEDLAKRFMGKFREVSLPQAVKPAVETTENPVPKTKAPAFKPVESSLGTDVSDQFPEALAEEFRVFQKGKKLYIAEPPSFDDALNDKGLSLDEMKAYIQELLK